MLRMSESHSQALSVLALKHQFPEIDADAIRTFCDLNGIFDATARIHEGENENQLIVFVEDLNQETVRSLVVGIQENVLAVISFYTPPAEDVQSSQDPRHFTQVVQSFDSVRTIKAHFPEIESEDIRAFCVLRGINDKTADLRPNKEDGSFRVVIETADGDTIEAFSLKVSDGRLEAFSSYRPVGQELRRLANV